MAISLRLGWQKDHLHPAGSGDPSGTPNSYHISVDEVGMGQGNIMYLWMGWGWVGAISCICRWVGDRSGQYHVSVDRLGMGQGNIMYL